MAESRKRGPYAKGEARREEILNRALGLVAERGSANLSMRAIAVELGVSHSAIQHYFGSIEEILVEVIALRDARGRRADGSFDELLREELARGATDNTRSPGLTSLYTSMLGASIEPGNDISREYFTQRFADGRAELEQVIDEGRRAGTVPEGPEASHIAALIMAAFDGLQVQWLLDPSIDIRAVLSILDGLIGDAAATPEHHHEPASSADVERAS